VRRSPDTGGLGLDEELRLWWECCRAIKKREKRFS
jgi:hypothetical protein